MIFLFTVAAPARSGTRWYSQLFTTEISFCYWELTTLHRGFPGNLVLEDWARPQLADHDFEQAQRRWVLEWFPEYFPHLWERAPLGQHIVGNSDHFVLGHLVALWLLWPDMRFIYSSRNGISAVQSRVATAPTRPWFIERREEQAWKTTDVFTQACQRWASEVDELQTSKAYLAGKARSITTTLEKLTTDVGELKRVWNWLGIGRWDEYEERNQKMCATHVNRHVSGPVHTWEQTWQEWTPQQRAVFRDVCGRGQRALGYELP